jgi:hypothetical protein
MNMSEKRKTTEDHIIDQIQRTGYPLEIEVSDLMERAGWIIFNNQPYLDEDEGKTREIDIYAIHETEADQFVTEPKPRIFVGTDIVIECKKSTTHAWIFFTRPKGLPPGFGQDQTLDFLQVHSNGKKRFMSTVALPKLHYDKFHTVAHTYAEAKLQGESSEKREIFEGRPARQARIAGLVTRLVVQLRSGSSLTEQPQSRLLCSLMDFSRMSQGHLAAGRCQTRKCEDSGSQEIQREQGHRLPH